MNKMINLRVSLRQRSALCRRHSPRQPGKAPPISAGLSQQRPGHLLLLASLAELACPIKHKHFSCNEESNSHTRSKLSDNSPQSFSDKTRYRRHTQSSVSCSMPIILGFFFLTLQSTWKYKSLKSHELSHVIRVDFFKLLLNIQNP